MHCTRFRKPQRPCQLATRRERLELATGAGNDETGEAETEEETEKETETVEEEEKLRVERETDDEFAESNSKFSESFFGFYVQSEREKKKTRAFDGP